MRLRVAGVVGARASPPAAECLAVSLTEAARRCWIGLGGNVGDVAISFDLALAALDADPGLTLRRHSRRYRTRAWGLEAQADFLNAVAEFDTVLAPEALLDVLQAVERAQGRRRDDETRWGPRTLDLDILAIEGLAWHSARLTLPHPRLSERAFVLVPWADIASNFELPGLGRVSDLCASLDHSGVEAIP